MSRRTEGAFWVNTKCPECNHNCIDIYKPDLLDGPVECECDSKNNILRRKQGNICYNKWSIAADKLGRAEIRHLIAMAEEKDFCEKRLKELKKHLQPNGY